MLHGRRPFATRSSRRRGASSRTGFRNISCQAQRLPVARRMVLTPDSAAGAATTVARVDVALASANGATSVFVVVEQALSRRLHVKEIKQTAN